MNIQKSIIGVFAKTSSKYKFSGTGFFIGGGLILTCTHVVDSAQLTDGKLRFRIEGDDKRHDAEVIFKSDAIELDIAILKPLTLTETPPALPLLRSNLSEGHEFKSFGYPLESDGEGLHGWGQIYGLTRDTLGREGLQIASDDITHGFSGGPVWDEQAGGVIGMIASGFDFGLDKKLGRVAFSIPSEILQGAYPALKFGTPKLAKTKWFYGHRYPDVVAFTGRADELKMLDDMKRPNNFSKN